MNGWMDDLIISKTLCFCSAITVVLHLLQIAFLQIKWTGLFPPAAFSSWHVFELCVCVVSMVECSQRLRLKLDFPSAVLLLETFILVSLALESLDTPPPDPGTPASVRFLLRQHMAGLLLALCRLIMLLDSVVVPATVPAPRGKEEVEE
jgi:hypothetical protein